MDKVAIYARVSTTDKQDYDRQVNDLTTVILNNGYKLEQIEVFAEKVSGYKIKEDRPEITRLLNIIESDSKYFNAIYVTEVSRLGRNPRMTKEIIERISDFKVPITITNPSHLTTLNPDGSRNNFVHIILSIAIEFADQEAQVTKSRMMSGKLQRAKEGRSTGNNPSFGYKSDENKMLVIDTDESIVVEQIFEMYSEGMGSDAIAKTLNQMSIPTRYNKSHANKEVKIIGSDLTKSGTSIKWEGVTIRNIIKNQIYIGNRIFKEHTIKAPQIISEELFNQCNELLSNKSTRNFITTYEYLLRDLAYCGCCGKKFYGQYSPNPRGAKVYKCASYIRAKGCGNTSINISLIESIIFNEFINSQSLLSLLENPNDLKKGIEKELKALEQQDRNESTDRENKLNEQSKLLDLYLSSPSINPNLLNSKQDNLNKEIKAIDDRIRLIKKEIFQKKKILNNYDQEQASIDMLVNAKSNRHELYAIFKQMIHKVIINNYQKNYTLATLFIKVKGIVLERNLKLLINSGAVRNVGYGRSKEYKYTPILALKDEPKYTNNIITDDELKKIEPEIDYIMGIANKNEFNILPYKIVSVPNDNWLMISNSNI